MPTESTCSACGRDIPPDDGYRAYDPAGARAAAFCRLEHVVPWSMRGAVWETGPDALPAGLDHEPNCAACGEGLVDTRVVLVRRRDAHRIADGFCSADHMAEWAKVGGRWA